MAIAIGRLAPADRAPFAGLTFPALRPFLVEGPGAIAVGAWEGSMPVGLALARQGRDRLEGEVLSLLVAPALRGHGQGRQLLAALELALAEAGARRVTASYVLGKPTTPALERLLARQGWSASGPASCLARVPLAALTSPTCSPPAGGEDEFLPWEVLGPADAASLMATWAEAASRPPGLPFELAGCAPAAGLAWRRSGRGMGWLLLSLEGDVARLASVYLPPELHTAPAAGALLSAACGRVAGLGATSLAWPLLPGLAAFYGRWLAPHVGPSQLTTWQACSRRLTPPAIAPWEAPEAPEGRRYALLAGVSSYVGTDLWDLPTAVAGTEALREVLVAGHGFRPEDVTLLREPDAATLAAALAATAARAGEADVLLFYYAGHAERLDGQTLLAPRGYRESALARTALSLAAVATTFVASRAGQKLRLYETCFAGQADSTPGAGPLLAACGTDEVAGAAGELGMGVFTAALVRALAGAAATEAGELDWPGVTAYVSQHAAAWAARLGMVQQVVASPAAGGSWRLGPPGMPLHGPAEDIATADLERLLGPVALAVRMQALGGRLTLTTLPGRCLASRHAEKLAAGVAWLGHLEAWAARRNLPVTPFRLAGSPLAGALARPIWDSPVGSLLDWDVRMASEVEASGARTICEIGEPASYPPSSLRVGSLGFTVVCLAAGLALWTYVAPGMADGSWELAASEVLDASSLPLVPTPLELARFEAALDGLRADLERGLAGFGPEGSASR